MNASAGSRHNSPSVPATEEQLLARARSLAGHTVLELATRAGREVPVDLRRNKGFIGHLAEWALGAPSHTKAAPDFEALGVELKTVPLSERGVPRESTFVCTIDLRTIANTDWESSALKHKLQRVLWVPIEADKSVPLPARRFGTPLLWTLGGDDEAVLRADWEHLVELISRDDLDRVTAHLGTYLQVRPKAAHSRERRRVVDRDEVPTDGKPRGFYLRRKFTTRLFTHPNR